jgi:hypothetical protein
VIRGAGCRIHPSAVVEACIIGRNVEIGPLSVVRGCLIADNVRIMEHCLVDGSVLGDGVMVNQQGMIRLCLAYPGAVFNYMQTGVVGRHAHLGSLARPLDMKMKGTIRVQHRGRLVDTRPAVPGLLHRPWRARVGGYVDPAGPRHPERLPHSERSLAAADAHPARSVDE